MLTCIQARIFRWFLGKYPNFSPLGLGPYLRTAHSNMVEHSISLLKSIEEISAKGDEPPSRFIIKEYSLGDRISSAPLENIPVIDLSLLSNGIRDEISKIGSALSSWGCFQLIGHGMSNSFLDDVRGVAKKFILLPMEEKHKCLRAANEIEGYGNDPILSENQVLDWCDRLFLKLYPEDERRLELWPENPHDFRDIMHKYSSSMMDMSDILLKAMAKSLDLQDNSFLKQFGKQATLNGRFNFYPTCPRPEQVLGLKAHSDGSAITILLQDDKVGGLQILKDNKWFGVPIMPHAFVVNLGGQMQIMSNGIFKSPMHRVAANSRERISLAAFYMPGDEVEIGPAEGLVDENRPRLYKKVKNYAAINFECFQSGKIAIDTVKV